MNAGVEDQEKLRVIMKYRLFGRDGVTNKEFKKLKDYLHKEEGPNEEREYVVRRKQDYDYNLSVMQAYDAAR